jgi:hypothetical protein
MNRRTLLFIVSLVGMAISAAVLILLIPSLFRPGEQVDIWLVGGLAVLVVALAAGARRWRPPTPVSKGR